jgi:hypothetical protein
MPRRPLARRLGPPALLLGPLLLLPGAAGRADDTDLFRTNVPPNVLLIVDNSKSMTNTVWHADYGRTNAPASPTNAAGSLLWKEQDDCTHFRDAMVAAGYSSTTKIQIYPAGRRVNYKDLTGFVVRTRGTNVQAHELPFPVLDRYGVHLWNDVDSDGVRDAADPNEWLAYYRICNPADDAAYAECQAIADLDGDGSPGQTVRDANGDPIVDGASGRTLLYRYDPNNTAGLATGLGSGTAIKRLTYITPLEVALAAGIDPTTYALTGSDICGVDPSAGGWSLFEGESQAETPNGFTIQYEPRYLDFLFSSPYGDAAREAVFAPTASNDGIRTKSACLTLAAGESSTYETYRRTRLMALRLTLRTVTCELQEDVRFGLMQFRFHGKPGDDNGGYVSLPIASLKNPDGSPNEYWLHGIYASHEAHMARVISKVGPDAQTPLNEAMFQAYTYFMSRDPAQLPPGRDWDGTEITTGESFPTYTYNLDLHNPLPDDGGDLNMPGGLYVCGLPSGSSSVACTGLSNTTTHPRPAVASNLDADGLDPLGDGGLAPFPAWSSEPAPDPVQYGCQRNFILFVTDGGSSGDLFDDEDARINSAFQPPTPIETSTDRGYADFFALIGDHYRNADGSADEVELPGGGSIASYYFDDIAYFMNRWDFRPDLDGDQTIDTYTVGFSVDTTGVSNVERAAIQGNGLFFESSDADQLAEDITAAFTDIIEKAQSFTSATVPASRTTDGNNFYSSFFRPKDDSPFWDGHLKNFDFSAAGDILTADGKCAVGTDANATPPCPANGLLRTTATAFWDAGEEVPDPEARDLFVSLGGTGFGAQAASWSLSLSAADLHLDAVAALDPLLLQGDPYLVADPSDSSQLEASADALVSSVAGCEYGTLLGSDCVTRTNEDGSRNLLTDIFHSNPVVVGSPNSPLNQASYQSFASAFRTRDRVIYAGANDGFLHGFLAGQWDPNLVPPRHDRGTGEEVLAFMPSWVRDRIWKLPGSQTAGGGRSFYGVDGSPVVADVWLYRSVNSSTGALESVLSPAVSTARQMQQWRTVLFGGLRGGGQSYFALDVTDPSGSTYPYPGYLWEFPCDDCLNAANGGTSAEVEWMGFTWSEPVITRVRVKVEGDSTPGGHERWVAIFGAGYHPWGDPNDPAYVAPGDPAPVPTAQELYDGYLSPNQGRALYMVDVTTGEVLAEKKYESSPVVCGTSPAPAECEMKYAIASQPAVFDLDTDGFADVVFVGDLGGNLFKWVVKDVGDDPIHNATSDKDVSQPDWPFGVFFRAGYSDPAADGSPNYGSSHFNSFFFPPTGAKRRGELRLAIGAGERAAPEAGVADGDDSNNNHFFVLPDHDPLEREDGAIATRTEADLVSNADLDLGTYTCAQIGESGFYLTARDREKFITNSVIFFGEVFTGSFVPADPGADPCAATGTSYLYRFGLDCGEGAWPSNPGSGNDDRRKAVGGGLPTRPRVSVGGLNQGGSTGTCDNKVVVITSDGNIENDCPAPLPSSGIDIRSWRER